MAFVRHRQEGGFAELRDQPWALKLEPPVVVDSVCTVIRMALVPPLPETALFPKLGCCPQAERELSQ